MTNIKKILSSISCVLLLSACGETWLGEDKVLDLQGERISLVAQSNDLKVSKIGANPVKLDTLSFNDSWSVSNANSNQVKSNLLLKNNLDEVKNTISFSISNDISFISPPIISDGQIYLIETDGVITATDFEGSTIWHNNFFRKLNKKSFFDLFSSNYVSGGLLANSGKIFATGGYNSIIALDQSSGDEVWSTKLSSPSRSAPVSLNSKTILVQTIDNKLFAINKNNGEIIWAHFGISDEVSILSGYSLDVSENYIAFQYSTGEIFVVNGETGDEVWSETISSPLGTSNNDKHLVRVISSPVIANNKFVITYGSDGYTAAYDLQNGSEIWKKELMISKPFWISGNTLFAISGSNLLIAVNVSDGTVVWTHDLNQHIDGDRNNITWTSPIVVNNNVLTISSTGNGLFIDAKKGVLVDTKHVSEKVNLSPIIVSNDLFITSDDGYIHRF